MEGLQLLLQGRVDKDKVTSRHGKTVWIWQPKEVQVLLAASAEKGLTEDKDIA